ncbi:UNVERIFIED_CONTAM: hypothetical protein Scaly_2705800 [Sesamum calycinum]|uniref:Integrase catalytic domain-containing protein n=1 Tax=Sesamum calycinum TaxID=2727403 RepID=A0AAW2J4D9_9LAMI
MIQRLYVTSVRLKGTLRSIAPTFTNGVLRQGCLSCRKPNNVERYIYVGDGKAVQVEAIGKYRLLLKIGGGKFSLFLDSKLVGSGSLSAYDNLYSLDTIASFNESLHLSTRGIKRKLTNKNSASLWHKRLGHISKRQVERLVSDGILEPLDFADFDVCVNYITGKQTNMRRYKANRAMDVLELIHTDTCGPFSSAAWNGQQYFVTFIDDFSRYGYIYLIHEKLQSLDVFKSFRAKVENQLDKRIKSARSNRGGEYYGRYDGSGEQRPGPVAKFLEECGIVPQYTMSSSPTMNGVAER